MTNWNKKSILITGGAGFIGNNLCLSLLEKGANISVVDTFSKIDSKFHEDYNEVMNIVDSDITDKNLIDLIPKNIDYVFHLAAVAYPRACEKDPLLAMNVNVQGTANLLHISKELGVDKFVFPSSAQLYGITPSHIPTSENADIRPYSSVYTLSKHHGEDLCRFYSEYYNLDVLIFRFYNVYGPYQSLDYLIPTVINQAIKTGEIEIWNGTPTRDFLFVDDLIVALLKGVTSKCKGPINLGTGIETTVDSLIAMIAKKMGVPVRNLHKKVGGAMKMCCDYSNAKQILSWTPEVDVETGIDKTIKWFKANTSHG